MSSENILEIRGLKKYFPVNKGILGHHVVGTVKALDGIDLTIRRGETLGLIGESGCGKSTLARVILGLTPATEGEIFYKGRKVDARRLGPLRREISMVFQDPYSSLDPMMKMGRIIEEPLRIHTRLTEAERRKKALALIRSLGFHDDDLEKYPHEFSGGQRQRIGIARAFILDPAFVICDEPVSALDVSIQAQILNLFQDLGRERGVTYLFISHDMSVIKHVSSRIAVMYLGHVVELADRNELFTRTLHPYTRALIGAIPIPDPDLKTEMKPLEGELPSPLNPPPGCPFRSRCPKAMEICGRVMPSLADRGNGHLVACHSVEGKGAAC